MFFWVLAVSEENSKLKQNFKLHDDVQEARLICKQLS